MTLLRASASATLSLLVLLLGSKAAGAQRSPVTSDEYRNPILFADYSDPDVIRDGKDFYLISSTFHFVPGIPILHSTDLVHWQITGHVLPRLTLDPAYDLTGPMRYGGGVWAPAIRHHDGLFYVYFPTPDEGIFVSTAPSMAGPWSAPATVLAGPGYEDPCPFWDDDGTAWLVHSRKGAGPLILHRMSADGLHLLDEGKVIVQDPVHLKTLEGPKLYKRNGWYYIFAPMGGVATGSQAVLRSRSIQGPYDYRIVLSQGGTDVNGPHQGGWVEGTDGRGWFLHFQQRGAHGRIVWLEPLRWQDDWPLVGKPVPGQPVSGDSGTGEPVDVYNLPAIVPAAQRYTPQTSDSFSSTTLSSQWEWNHNPDDSRWSLTQRPGHLRLHPGQAADLLHARNTLTQTMQSESLSFTATLDVSHMANDDRAGVSAFDRGLSGIAVIRHAGQRTLFFIQGSQLTPGPTLPSTGARHVQLRTEIHGNTATYLYSLDQGHTFQPLGPPVALVFSWWKGARPALFSFNTAAPSTGYVDFDQVTVQPLP